MFWKLLSNFSRTLNFRLNLWYSALFLVCSALLCGLIYFLIGAALERTNRDALESRLREYIAVYEAGGVPVLRDWAQRINEARRQRHFFVRVIDPSGAVLLRIVPDEWSDDDVRLLSTRDARSRRWVQVARDAELDLNLVTAGLDDGTQLQLGRVSDARAAFLRRIRQVFVVTIAPILLLAFIVGALLTRRLTHPLRRMIETASAIVNTGRLGMRVPTQKTNDELEDLVLLFNRLLDHNERLFGTLRDSLDNVAHDLRTPLARLRASLEDALSRKQDSARENILDALEETERVETTIRAFMDVAQAESGLLKPQLQPLDLGPVVAEAVELYEPVAQDKMVRLENRIISPLPAEADAMLLRQVFANLLDNAVKFTPAGGEVTISANGSSEALEIKVTDSGCGIPAADLPRVWERLYRGDKSRSQHGLGLGLSLVKAIIEAHGGKVRVHSEEGRGCEFVVQLPKTTPQKQIS